jgi:VWFA-related protein
MATHGDERGRTACGSLQAASGFSRIPCGAEAPRRLKPAPQLQSVALERPVALGRSLRSLKPLVFGMLALAILPGKSPAQEPTFRSSVPVVLVPVTVMDRNGRFVEGLKPDDFALTSDGKLKQFHMDSAESVSAPLAIVIAVQTNDLSLATNQKVRKVGSLIQPLLTGDRGRAAIVGYGDKPVLLADFTRDPNVLEAAFEQTAASQGGYTARQIDAVAYAARMLAARPRGERKILILLGESKDRGSLTRLGDALKIIQQDAVTVFAATWSPYRTAFTTQGKDMPNSPNSSNPPPLPSPPNPYNPPGIANTSGNVDLRTGIDEVARLVQTDSVKELVYATGGDKLGFNTLQGLESALTRLGEELHGQYLLSFPAQDATPGYHELAVQVKDRRGLKVRARLGFWVGEKPIAQP